MYIQITTKCSMRCRHCAYSCGPKGIHMPFKIFQKALQLCDEHVALGGGEPTVHPEFEKFLLHAMAKCDSVWLATNGKHTERALVLAGLARQGKISCALSLDEFHGPISPKVVEAFTKGNKRYNDRGYVATYSDERSRDSREIRNVTGKVVSAGRAKKNGLGCSGAVHCVCSDQSVKPDGCITWCGCSNAPMVGDVWRGITNSKVYEFSCYQDYLKRDEAERRNRAV